MSFPALLMRGPDTRVKICGISTSPDVPFDVDDLQLLQHHAAYGCMSVWCVTPERAYPFVFLPRRFKRVLPGVQLIYCRDIEDVVRFAAPLGHSVAIRTRRAGASVGRVIPPGDYAVRYCFRVSDIRLMRRNRGMES